MKALLKTLFAATVLGALVAGCGGGGGGSSSAGDTVAPTVLFTTPPHNASAIGTNSSLAITFSEAIDPSTVTNATIVLADTTGGVPVNLTSLSYDATNRIVTMTPAPLTGGHSYTAQVTTNVRDLAGNRVASPYIWSFTTAGPDVSVPTVTSTSPLDAATGVGTNASIAMTFSEPMDAASVQAAFSLNPPTPGTMTYFGKTAVFRPTALLNTSTTYTATLAASAKDLAGIAMGVAKTWTFFTGAGPDTSKPTVTSVSPAVGATGVSRTADITVTFDKAVHPNIFGNIDGHATDVTVDYTTNTVTMKPANPLQALTVYPFVIQVRDLSGNLMAAPYPWSFTTGN